MRTILESPKALAKLLGKQNYRADVTYRLMTFVVQTPVDDGLLLFNNMTKQMVLLTKEEQQVFEQQPSDLADLISNWFLVPLDHDDCKLSDQFRNVARMIEQPKQGITSYTIMTTSDCNARCFYCYELGQSRRPMTEETANKAADFIIRRCEGNPVSISWFGGEPLYNKEVIDLICNRLCDANIEYKSSMISNGFLMDADTVKQARDLWKLENIQITIDGTEKIYNRVKAYIYKGVNAYQRVLDNISHLLEAGIFVNIRMNMDTHNADDLERLAQELHERFAESKYLNAYLHLLFKDELHHKGVDDDLKRPVLLKKMKQIQDKLQDWGMFRTNYYQPFLRTNNCMSDNDSTVVIQPDGYITKCEHYTDSQHVGHVDSDEFDAKMIAYFKEQGEPPLEYCRHCAKYPLCIFLTSCPHYKECYPEMPAIFVDEMQQEMKLLYDNYLKKEKETASSSESEGRREV
ncbi:MAG: radical SAM protein [Bacteroidaceae bacterium]|nr:radical SAM protein [Bacteroidaceae bacterium]